MKKSARREQLQREEAEQRRLKTVLELQFILDRLGDDTVRQDLKQGVGSSPLLTDADLAAFDEFYKLVGPDRDQSIRSAQDSEKQFIGTAVMKGQFCFWKKSLYLEIKFLKLITCQKTHVKKKKRTAFSFGSMWKTRKIYMIFAF